MCSAQFISSLICDLLTIKKQFFSKFHYNHYALIKHSVLMNEQCTMDVEASFGGECTLSSGDDTLLALLLFS